MQPCLLSVLLLHARSGVGLSGEGQYAGSPQESSTLPSSKGPQGALAGTNGLHGQGAKPPRSLQKYCIHSYLFFRYLST